MTAQRTSVLKLALRAGPAILIVACSPAARAAGAQLTNESATDNSFAGFLSDQRVTTLVRSDYFQSSRTLDGRSNLAGAALQVKALPSLTASVDGKIEARLIDSDLGDNEAADRSVNRLLEAYATIHFARADLRLGKQIIAWGRADGINPTDNLTPRDYTVLLPFDEDQRFGTVALKLDTYLSRELSLTVFATPFFEPSNIPIPAGAGLVNTKPAQTLSDSEFALKLNRTGGDFDWSVSYFHGRSLFPTLAAGPPAPLLPYLSYQHIDVVGADFARNFGRYGFRSEVAYIRPTDRSATDPNVGSPRWFLVAGMDRTLLENLNFNLQFFTHRMSGYRNPADVFEPLQRSIAVENAIILGQEDRASNGVTFRMSNKWLNETLEAEIFTVVNFTRSDRYIRPLVTYAFSDQLKGTLGGELYRGSPSTQYGSLRNSSGVFAELRYGL